MDNEKSIFDENIAETILYYIDLFVKENPQCYIQEKFLHIIYDGVYELLRLTLGEIVDVEDGIFIENIYENITYYFKTCGIPRSYDSSIIIKKPDVEFLEKKLIKLSNVPQPEQKSKEWFRGRWNMLTASSIWKALDTQASQNRLIYQKCTPIDINKCFRVNINSPMHKGCMYEPLSTTFYEHLYNTKIKEFGCIRHPVYPELGASPDGINNCKKNKRYGRMLEIKNIVNRVITGIPKKAYWIQMQMQMEVCDLEECDFLETRFKEYENEQEFLNDGGFDCSKIKGVICCFHGRSGPVYKYSPWLVICEEDKCREWIETCMENNKTMTWIHNIYWCLDEYSCVLVPRNRAWFKSALPSFRKIWKTILYERTNGYQHRKSKKREKKNTVILKVRTESFNETILQEDKNNTNQILET